MIPELHRPIAIERVGPTGLDVTVEASAAECAALALRMNLPAVLALTCEFHLERETAGTLLAYGHLLARVVQTCVVSLEDFTATVEERFAVRCVPDGGRERRRRSRGARRDPLCRWHAGSRRSRGRAVGAGARSVPARAGRGSARYSGRNPGAAVQRTRVVAAPALKHFGRDAAGAMRLLDTGSQ